MEANSISLDDRYQKGSSIVFRQIAGEAVLVPIRQKVGDLDCVYALNETASSAWELLNGTRTLRSVLGEVVAEYQVEEEVAAQDLIELIASLIEVGAVEKV